MSDGIPPEWLPVVIDLAAVAGVVVYGVVASAIHLCERYVEYRAKRLAIPVARVVTTKSAASRRTLV